MFEGFNIIELNDRSLLAAQSFAEALAMLDALAAAHPKDSAVVKFRALVQREQENTVRAKRIQKELDGLKMLMAEKKYRDEISGRHVARMPVSLESRRGR